MPYEEFPGLHTREMPCLTGKLFIHMVMKRMSSIVMSLGSLGNGSVLSVARTRSLSVQMRRLISATCLFAVVVLMTTSGLFAL